jgi:hypothetical protein
VGLILAVPVLAAIPAADGTITACMKQDGTIRLIDTEAGVSCKDNEKRVTWSQTGPQGAVGPEGPPGISGLHIVKVQTLFQSAAGVQGGINGSAVANCPEGEHLTGGGVQWGYTDGAHPDNQVTLWYNGPADNH